MGIHGIVFCGLYVKRKYSPTLRTRKQSILTVRSFARGASRIELGEASVLVHNRSQGAGASLNAAANAHHS